MSQGASESSWAPSSPNFNVSLSDVTDFSADSVSEHLDILQSLEAEHLKDETDEAEEAPVDLNQNEDLHLPSQTDQVEPQEHQVEPQEPSRFNQNITPQDVDNMIVDSARKTTAYTTKCHIRILKGKH